MIYLHQIQTHFFLGLRDIGEIGKPLLKVISGGPNNIFIPSFDIDRKSLMFACQRPTQLNISAMYYPDITNLTFNDFEILSTLSVTANRPMSGNRISSKQKKLFYSTTGLVTGFVNISNPRAITSITTHTRTAIGSETSASRLCLMVMKMF